MNIHIVHLPVFSIANTHARTSLLVLSGTLLGTRSLEIEGLGAALEVLKGLEVAALEDDTICDLRPEGPSRRAISVVA